MTSRRIAKSDDQSGILAFLLGMVITANFSLAPSLANAPRVLDVIMALLAAATLGKLLIRSWHRSMLWVLATAWFFSIYALWGAFSGDTSLTIASVRFATAALSLPVVVEILGRPNALARFLLGGALGAVGIAFIAVGQLLQPGGLFDAVIPLTAKVWWGSGGSIRSVGIWEHPNGLSQVQIIGATMALSLIWFPRRRLVGYLLFTTIVALTYMTTSTRAGIVGAGVAFILVHGAHPSVRYRFFALLAGWPLAVMALIAGPELLGERWTGRTASGMSLFDNLAERLGTNLNSFQALFEHFFGLGVAERLEVVSAINNGIAASHNSYLTFGLTFGLLPFVVLTATVLHGLIRKADSQFFPVLAVIAVLLLAEDSIFSSSMMFALLVARFSDRDIRFLHRSDGPSNPTPRAVQGREPLHRAIKS